MAHRNLPILPVTSWNPEDMDNWKGLGYLKETIEEIMTGSHYTPDMPLLQQLSHHYVFVYGTLKKGFRNHKLLAGYNMIGCGYTDRESFFMARYKKGAFPVAAFESQKEFQARLYGEVYQVDTEGIRDLDYLESNTQMYKRIPILINYYDKDARLQQCRAWTYLAVRDFWIKKTDQLQAMRKCVPNNGDSPYYIFTKDDEF